ncbi:hypothetical protein [Okeania sp. SIO1I7]|uniref:hypothetical protein n=1 Tax=Okeania sp. SIO1I7 TaxID=2607772 RepID=UPI0013F8AC60|nr:hypothetical protein [Okeania sp. SIO1I7]NET28852.1 hypothetical protein [Okeania sp. SIO1I7]
MQNSRILRQFVLQKLAKAPSISVQVSALDVLVICQALLAWLTVYPGSEMVKNLIKKLRNVLFGLLPNYRNEITFLLTHGAFKAYGNFKTNSQT